MTLQRFARKALPSTPWKNGGGTTREIAVWPPEAGLGMFDWRVSIGTVAANGPFSMFPGMDRTIVLLDGAGMRLRSADGSVAHRLDEPHEPFAFSGDAAVDCILIGGPASDFNVMTRRDGWVVDVRVFEEGLTLGAAEYGVLMSLDGHWQAGEQKLNDGEGVWWADVRTEWRLAPLSRSAKLVAVRWKPSPQ
jgi:environmental stress-induced protein Ves